MLGLTPERRGGVTWAWQRNSTICWEAKGPTLMMTGNIRYRERKGGGKSYSDNVRSQPSTPSLPHTASIHTSPFGS